MADGLEERVAAVALSDGWQPFRSDPRAFTRELGDGFQAVARVGIYRDPVSGPDAALFDAAVAAASCYAELSCVSAQLLWSDDEDGRVLAVAAPGPVHQPPRF